MSKSRSRVNCVGKEKKKSSVEGSIFLFILDFLCILMYLTFKCIIPYAINHIMSANSCGL